MAHVSHSVALVVKLHLARNDLQKIDRERSYMEKFDDDDDDNSATSVQQQRWSEKIGFTILEIGRNWAEIDDER
ncbi:hypothetical protein T05_4009 [Trichinella murrelli]|uniref:Uncharacterized protein n=1 Tax=Trichinella murrelli TaxID=144512 RepID=A0A0V0TPX5_9BILA|nr:hypothetical protein T05_4009 [Trichinella murrelli]